MVSNNSANEKTAATGKVLQGQGVGTASDFSTATYPATAASGDLIYASATNVIGGLAVPTNGWQVGSPLDYNGTLPNYFNFAKEIFMYEDWIQNASAGWLGWNTTTASSGSVVMQTNVSPTVIGNVNLLTSTSSNGRAGIGLGNASMTFGGGRCILTWLLKLSRLSDSGSVYTAYIGFGNSNTAPTTGVYFSYTHGTNSGNWVLNANDNSSITSTNSSTAADTNWHKFTIDVNAGATSAEFFIDGTSLGTVASNIPQASGSTHTCSPQCAIVNAAGAHSSSSEMWIDAMQMYQLLTSQR